MDLEFIDLQQKLEELSNENIISIFQWLRNSKFMNNLNKNYFNLIRNIYLFSFYRPKKVNILSNLSSIILKNKKIEESLDILFNCFISINSPFSRVTSIKVLFFMNSIDFLKIPYLNVIEKFENIFLETHFVSEDYFYLFVLLAPSFEKFNNELYLQVFNEYLEAYPMWVNDFPKLSFNDWELHKKNRKNYGIDGSLTSVIKQDDFVKLQMAFAFSTIPIEHPIRFSLYEYDINIVNPPNLLDFSAFCGSIKCLNLLIDRCKNQIEELKKTSHSCWYSIAGGNIECFKKLESLNFLTDYSLHISVLYHQTEIFNNLLKDINDLNIYSPNFGNLIHCSLKSSNYYVLNLCLNNNLDINLLDPNGFSPLEISIQNNDIESIKLLLLCSNLNINLKGKNGMTPLCFSIQNNKFDIINLLLNHPNIDINLQDDDGLSPLAHAACNGNIELLNKLLKFDNINVNLFDNENSSPLISAYEMEEFDAFKILLNDPRVIFDQNNEIEKTLLHQFAANNTIDLFELIINRPNININLIDNMGQTPLHHAAINGNIEIIKILLLNNNININLQDFNGRSSLHYAVKHQYIEIVKLLLNNNNINVNILDENIFFFFFL